MVKGYDGPNRKGWGSIQVLVKTNLCTYKKKNKISSLNILI